VLADAGKTKKAIEILESILNQSPNDIDALSNIANIYYHFIKDYKKSLE